jgi:hypothetical protein
MPKIDSYGTEKHPIDSGLFMHHLIVPMITMAVITNDRLCDMI